MAGQSFKLYLFGDQTFDVKPHLRSLLRDRSNPVLEDFLVKAYEVVRTEIYKLPHGVREAVPRFTGLDDLVSWDQSGKRCIPLDMAVTCIYQLGVFISQADAWNYGVVKPRVAGICTGALAAAAVSCSRNLLELVPMAVDAVTVAFRIGMQVADVAQRVSPSHDADQSWSIIVPGAASSEAVSKFCEQSALPLTSRPYITAYAPNGITVSGPPKSLEQLVNSGDFKDLRFKSVPIFGPYHAPHLYSQFDISNIIGDLTSDRAIARAEHLPLLSGQAGAKSQARNFATLLEAAVGQVLLQPIRWSDILDELQSSIQNASPKSFSVTPIGTTADQLIYTVLKQTSLRTLVSSTSGQSKPAPRTEGTASSLNKPKLAIIGMSGRFPDAKDNEAFWSILHEGLDVHKPVPSLHWDAKTHVDPTGSRKNTSGTPYGCWLNDPAMFDARFFNISPREAPQIDPAQRLALMTAYEAIEQAGIIPDATPSTRRDRVGVFYGVTSNDWMETNSAQKIDTYFIPGGNRAFIPGRINYCFKFSGPSYAVDTACSSSLAGIHLACNSLWRGDIDTAVAGGTNVLTNPDFTAGLDRGHFLSRTGNCKTFDDGADGYCRGEGIGTIILKRLDDALADNDPILGVILGASTNHSAESESITRPHSGAQRAVFSTILNQSAVDPYSISYVEMHGTGTQAGDASEMSSVLDTFAPPLSQVKTGRANEEALYLGSAKANIGHGEAASGVTSLIKVLLMMQKNMIVPHCGIKTQINRKFPTDLQERNVNIALKPTALERSADPSKPRRAFVNNFSAAGGNTALLIEDAPLKPEALAAVDPRSHHLVACSAKNGVSLQGNLRSMLNFLKQNPRVSMGQLSYTTTARRLHHPHRVMLSGSADDICSQIEAALRDNSGMTRPKSAPKLIFTFTGQGAQYPGMGKQLLENFSVFRTEMCRLDQIAQSLGFPSMLSVIRSEEQDIGVFPPTAVQLASICMQIALNNMWASWNITPSAVVGHSLGEYAALNAAGVLSDADTIYLVGKRADLLQEKCTRDTHAMLVVKGSVDEISSALRDLKCETACINSPVETVLAGSNEHISNLKGLLTDSGIKCTLLKVPYAFHSSQIDPILSDFKRVASGVTFSKAKIPILCPLNGGIVTEGSGAFGPEYLASHSREPVNMLKALEAARSSKIVTDQSTMLEIGPHPAISGMVSAVLGPQVRNLSSLQRGRSVWQVLGATIKSLYTAGADIRWAEYHRDFKSSHTVLPLPAYSWDLREYWMQYVNDWSLRKGDPPLTTTETPGLESTTIHRVVEETGDSKNTHIVVEADIARKDLSPLVQGHEVDGIPLCTPSVYADIALTLGNYLVQRYRPGQQEKLVDVSDMTISKALILRAGATQQLLQAHVEVDWPTQSAAIKFMSFDNKQKLQEHSRCVLRFKDSSLQQVLQKGLAKLKQKRQALRDGVAAGVTARFNRPMVYRAIRPLARFHDDYRAIDEIVLNSKTLEASSRLSFSSVKRGGNYHTHPAIIDSLTQSCGFAMNCNDGSDLDNEVFMNHGWGSFQIFEPLDFGKAYTTYTRMEEGADKLWHGDVVILDGDKVVAFFGQIAIQGVPRRILKVILSIESGNTSQKKQPVQKQQALTLPPSAVKASKAAPPAAVESHVSKLAQALAVIAEESGLAVADLTDGTVFGDVGIDSLLGLTISARFKEELDMDLDFNALFYEYPTVGDLKVFLGGSTRGTAISSPRSSSTGSSTPVSSGTGATTPNTEDFGAPKVDFKRALGIISEESGVATDELTDDTNFADSGVDSLLSLVIVSRFRDELELEIQHESLFLECPTVADLKELLLGDANSGNNVQPAGLKSSNTRSSTPVVEELSASKVDFQRALDIISEESGVATEELTDDTNFADSGVDSLLSLVIVSRFRDELELDIQHESLFLECPTVADLKQLLLGDAGSGDNVQPAAENATPKNNAVKTIEIDTSALAARKQAVDELVKKYTAGFSAPGSSPSSTMPSDNEKVILVTGASGSLGGHLVYHIAQLPDVKRVVCLNRENKAEPYDRQQKAMRGKGIRFPEALKSKLLVLQTDSAKPMFGLPKSEYEGLVNSVTHLVHNAWPMSAKRPLAGFESQFQVMRNLIDFSSATASRRPDSFQFSFQMVSSIGVVGHYGLASYDGTRTMVPEQRVGIDTVLPNGYGDAKWGCERMLDETLHKYPNRFRTMAVRLGQIAGSKTSGYWNPMEHFGFLIKSSQTLNALPDVDGTVFWTPVNDIAGTLSDLVLSKRAPHPIYHIENPVGQAWRETNAILADALKIPNLIPFDEWVERVRNAPQRNNPASTLLDFLDGNYLRMSCGGLVLDISNTLEHSKTLSAVGPVSEEVVRKYIHIWKEIGFLN
ncbi:starter unit:ACP transacylase in aflatoxin biosynthesis domain-containing protein [Hirsutella rhossiliensis]|uniref:Starter unit:ACP transacylase in aflatoxin biosynthesis domain-containing protein n=1 Tax=Hirsutella rhossiliensis TaxID=111463 RepID=A0A9P8N7P5_9HYPO|nr:starter unit:ACP transacylase in aflatoxin biosynthesis domain-containing protein [Hirsutella rhossiliensis]KAH0966147.1 starter unit:ACP transacylase in aflatoxin biosynthesis domain-containing protein [Hirsutella rhossiliensis]